MPSLCTGVATVLRAESVFMADHSPVNESNALEVNDDRMLPFPADFLWGAATAAYQIEGAVSQPSSSDIHVLFREA